MNKKNARQLVADVIHYLQDNTTGFPQQDNYNPEDENINTFFKIATAENLNEYPNVATTIVEDLDRLIEAESLVTLRYAYQNLKKTINPQEDAILLEDLDSNITDLSIVRHRLEASQGLDRYAELNPHKTNLINDVQTLVLDGRTESIKEAINFIKTIYVASAPATNIRTAYTTLSTQAGEPYQMCPKAEKQIGWAIPMELSKCRDNCIDSRKSRVGEVTCAYQDWLRVVADNQESVLARLAKQKMDNTIENSLNDITRPGPAENEQGNYNQMIEESEIIKDQNTTYKREELLEESIEANLEKRKLNTKQSSSNNRIVVANTSNNNNGDSRMKKFNLQEHINAQSVNDQLEQYRAFFATSIKSDSMSEVTNKDRGGSIYESPDTSMEKLVALKHSNVPEDVQEAQLEKYRKGENAVHTTPQNETLNAKRTNDSIESFMKTMEEKLEQRRTNK
jgi:hypothetical protein